MLALCALKMAQVVRRRSPKPGEGGGTERGKEGEEGAGGPNSGNPETHNNGIITAKGGKDIVDR